MLVQDVDGLDGWVYVLDKLTFPSAGKFFPDPRSSWNCANSATAGFWLFERCMFWVMKKTLVLWKIGDQVRHAWMICSHDPPQIMGRVC